MSEKIETDLKLMAERFGENGFVFLDERPWPFLVTNKTGEWWLFYWSESGKNFVSMRKLDTDDVEAFRLRALPPSKAVWYAGKDIDPKKHPRIYA